jgi:hypothetical protein
MYSLLSFSFIAASTLVATLDGIGTDLCALRSTTGNNPVKALRYVTVQLASLERHYLPDGQPAMPHQSNERVHANGSIGRELICDDTQQLLAPHRDMVSGSPTLIAGSL